MAVESIADFIDHHYRHYNAAFLKEAAQAYVNHIDNGGKMFLAMAGAMSTGELGLSLARMIREGHIAAVCCSANNLEEDIFNMVAHDKYKRIPNWRNLTPQMEKDLEKAGYNRVTDICIPEDEAFRAVEDKMIELWKRADKNGQRFFPHEYFYQLIDEGLVKDSYVIPETDSWVIEACKKKIPIFIPAWEDCTMGNIFCKHVIEGDISNFHVVKTGMEYMEALADWYCKTTMGKGLKELPVMDGHSTTHVVRPEDPNCKCTVGFFQIGGGTAGDFPICVVPMIHQDLSRPCPYWGYFCQISDCTTSYGSYSGAFPTEKITWGKLDVDTPNFMIESDASIVAPLIFTYVCERAKKH